MSENAEELTKQQIELDAKIEKQKLIDEMNELREQRQKKKSKNELPKVEKKIKIYGYMLPLTLLFGLPF